MDTTDTMPQRKVHQGRNVRRFREMFGVKQEILAEQVGMSQQAISKFEGQEELDDATLDKIAKALKIPVEAIKNMNDEVANHFINSFYDNSGFNYHCTFNPIDKIVELYNEKAELYERMLKAEKDKVTMLEMLLKEKK